MAKGKSVISAARSEGRRLFWSAFVFSIFVNLLMLTGPLFMLQIYDRVLTSRSEETLFALTILVIALYGLMGFIDWARGRASARIGGRMQEVLDGPVFRAGLTLKASHIPGLGPETGGGGQHLAALRDVEAIRTFYGAPIFLALMDLPWSPIFFLIIFIFHPWLGWLALFGAALLIVATLLNQLLTNDRVAAARAKTAEADHYAAQAGSGSEVIVGLGMQGAIEGRWRRRRREAMAQGLSANDWTGSFTGFAKSFRLFLQSAMLAAGAYLVLQNQLTPGAMIAASILLGRALAPIEQSLNGWTIFQRARAGWTGLSKVLAADPTVEDKTKLPQPEARLALEGVTLVSPNGRGRTLAGVSLVLEPGKALGVIGRSGSGKSTLAKTLVGLVTPNAGSIRLGGPTLDQYDAESLAAHVGYLPQDIALFDGTIAENIARMSESPDPEAVVRAAKRAAVHDLIVSLEAGYDTYIDGSEPKMSGGQRQRVALARALYGDPVLLVLDEPNSALDSEGTEALNQVVSEFKADGRSVIIMTHRPMAISQCDDLAVMDGGKLTAYGPRDEVLKAMLKNSDAVRRSIGPGTGAGVG
ncbi:MAG: type I secretion system permease/ATPase [Pseudomonadota bacterium]